MHTARSSGHSHGESFSTRLSWLSIARMVIPAEDDRGIWAGSPSKKSGPLVARRQPADNKKAVGTIMVILKAPWDMRESLSSSSPVTWGIGLERHSSRWRITWLLVWMILLHKGLTCKPAWETMF